MQDPFLLEATASEPLSMEEEVAMQREWRDDEKKCTFIILARDLLLRQNNDYDNDNDNHEDETNKMDAVPPPPSNELENDASFSDMRKKAFPNLVEQTLHAMIGDINLFLSEEEEESEEEEKDENYLHQEQKTIGNTAITAQSSETSNLSTTTTTPPQTTTKLPTIQAELDIMIAAPSHRHKNLGTPLALLLMHYGASSPLLQITRYFVKIHETNASSLKLFRDKLGFVQCGYTECFGEIELEVRCESADEMVAWVERRWRGVWCKRESKEKENMRGDGDGGMDGDEVGEICDGNDDGGIDKLYDIYECPLIEGE